MVVSETAHKKEAESLHNEQVSQYTKDNTDKSLQSK
jgi:hypothetical protein